MRSLCVACAAIVFQYQGAYSLQQVSSKSLIRGEKRHKSSLTPVVMSADGHIRVGSDMAEKKSADGSSAAHSTLTPSGLVQNKIETLQQMAMPLVGFGTCGKCNGPGLDKAFASFLDAGGRMFDTATMYGNHAQLGGLVKKSLVPRNELFVIDKIDPHTIREPQDVMRQIDDALAALQTDYVDLMLIHGAWGPLGSTERGRELLWLKLSEAKKLGKVKNIGVSNFNRTMIEALVATTGEWPSANEFEYHPWVKSQVKDLAEWCNRSGIQVIAYGSLGTGGFSRLYPAAVQTAANSHFSSPSDVLLRWALDQGVAVIPSSGNHEHIRGNLRLASLSGSFHLTMQEAAAIESEPRPKGWRRCTLLAGCFQLDNDDGDIQNSWLSSVGSWLVTQFSRHWQSFRHKFHACIPRTTDFTADSMDRISQSMMNRPELKPHVVRNISRGLGVIVLDSFLESQQVEAAVKAVMGATFVHDPIYERGHYEENEVRATAATLTNFDCNGAHTPLAIRRICTKIVSTLGIGSQYLEPVVAVRVYERGEFVKHHIDQVPKHEFEFCGRRTITALVHLGDAEGGGTKFESMNGHNYSVGVKPGRAIIFSNIDATIASELDPNTDNFFTAPVHESEPVKSGKKILMTFWFRQFNYAKANAKGCCSMKNSYPSLLAKQKACSCL